MTAKKKRPRAVTITLLGVMFLGALSAAKAFAIAQQVSLFLSLSLRPDPRLLLVIAAGWMVLFWGSAIALWHRHSFTRWLIPLYELVLQGLFAHIPISGQGWLLRILLYVAATLFAFWSLNRNETRSYFTAS